MSPAYSSQPTKPSHLLRKLVLLFLLATALGLGLAILFQAKPGYPRWMQNGLAAASLAVTAGLGSRFVLGGRNWFVRFLAALAALVFGLYVLGFATNWRLGLGPLVFWPKQVDKSGLAEIGIGLILFVPVFLAWKKSPQVMQVAETPRAAVQPRNNGTRRKSSVKRQAEKSPAISLPKIKVPDFLKAAQRPVKVKRSRPKTKKPTVRTISAEDLPVRPKRRRMLHGKAKVSIAVVEEHRCPYCLEPVSRTDPRGVVECEVCHTLHHKDCWEITGVCQVPHYNS